jgi:prepilin-type N-terminal cleavage/methylation domain-containing protein
MVPTLQKKRPMARPQDGFTLVELMVVVVIVGVLAAVGVMAYTRYVRKAKSAEVMQIFGEFKARQETFASEFGSYQSTGTEAEFFPTTLNGDSQTTIGVMPPTWQALRIQPGKGGLYCQYASPAGLAGELLTGAAGIDLFQAPGNRPAKNWFYLLAQCDWDGSDDGDVSRYYMRGDLTQLVRENEGK